MTRDEIVAALRCCAAIGKCYDCPIGIDYTDCVEKMAGSAADLIENQQREIEALRQANEGLRFNLAAQEGGEICRAALETFGKSSQMQVAIEEMSELTKELCKNGRGQENTTHIAEEIADLEIMLRQMVMLFDCEGQVDKFRRYKLERLGLLKGHREGGSRRYLVQLDHAMARPLVGLTIAAAGKKQVGSADNGSRI